MANMVKRMNRDEKIALLKQWEEAAKGAHAYMEKVSCLLEVEPESPLRETLFALSTFAWTQVAEKIGCSTEWLELWVIEHEFGKSPMRAGLKGEPMRTITTIDGLADLILADCG